MDQSDAPTAVESIDEPTQAATPAGFNAAGGLASLYAVLAAVCVWLLGHDRFDPVFINNRGWIFSGGVAFSILAILLGYAGLSHLRKSIAVVAAMIGIAILWLLALSPPGGKYF